jgi:hypothetical protein
MHWSSRRRIGQLPNGFDNPHPDRYASVVAIRGELVGPSRTFRLSLVAVARKHQVGDAPIVDLGYHAEKSGSLQKRTVATVRRYRDQFQAYQCKGVDRQVRQGDRDAVRPDWLPSWRQGEPVRPAPHRRRRKRKVREPQPDGRSRGTIPSAWGRPGPAQRAGSPQRHETPGYRVA